MIYAACKLVRDNVTSVIYEIFIGVANESDIFSLIDEHIKQFNLALSDKRKQKYKIKNYEVHLVDFNIVSGFIYDNFTIIDDITIFLISKLP